jgi:uncharacterized protein YciI
MKTSTLSLLLFSAWLTIVSCTPSIKVETETDVQDVSETTFDSVLANKLGADDYGMKKYVMAFLKAGPNRDQDSATVAEMQRAHMDNIGRLAESGKLVLAGPFMDDGVLRGIYVFNVTTIEEAAALTATDPMIQSGRLEMELHPWYGSATIMELNGLHKRVQKSKI